MYQSPCSGQSPDHRRDDAPFDDERDRYLRYCAEHGAAPAAVKTKRIQAILMVVDPYNLFRLESGA